MQTLEKIEMKLFFCQPDLRKFHKWDVVAVGDQPDAKECKVLYKSKILCNWPSWDLIRLTTGEKVRWRRGTIEGQRRYLFPYSDAIDVLCRRKGAHRRIKEYCQSATASGLAELASQVLERAGVRDKYYWLEDPETAMRLILTYLGDLSRSDLEALGDRLGPQANAAQPAA